MGNGHEQAGLAVVALGWLNGMSDGWKLALTIGAIFVAGVTAGVSAISFRGLPDRVGELETQALVNDSMHIALDARVRGVESDARLDRLRIEGKIDQLLCFSEADRGERSYESCVH